MYKVGFIGLEGGENLQNKLDLNQSYELCKLEHKNELDKYDGILILSEKKKFKEICEILIMNQEKFRKFIWVFTPESSERDVGIYLQLGANIVWNRSANISDLLIMIRNHFIRWNYEITKYKEIANSENEPIVLNAANLSVILNNGTEVSLTRKEFQLISVLYENANTAVSYQELFNTIWSNDQNLGIEKYRISNIIFHLRDKLAKEDNYSIKTVRSIGYLLDLK